MKTQIARDQYKIYNITDLCSMILELCFRLCAATGLDLEAKVNHLLGYCTISKKFNPGLLAESTKPIIQNEIAKLLENEGYSFDEAYKIIVDLWEEGDTSSEESLKAITDIRTLFKILKAHNVKVAISTSDSREGTMLTLKELRLEKYIDYVMCGDDPDIIPKPNPYSALTICRKLGVDPADTVMVGDTAADVGMGKAANLGWNVGVLSGVGNSTDLLPEAEFVIHSVKDILPLILPGSEWRQYYRYTPSERILNEPHHLEEEPTNTQSVREQVSNEILREDIELVIFDLHGTLLCTHTRYLEWLDRLCERFV